MASIHVDGVLLCDLFVAIIFNFVIDFAELATKQDVRARPSKIVAGLEADKTCELLISIAKAIDRKIDTTEAVALVKSGAANQVATKKDAKPTKTDGRKGSKDGKDSMAMKKQKSSDTKPLKKSDSNAKATKQSSKESIDTKKVKTRSSPQSRDKDKDKEKKIEREKKIDDVHTNERPAQQKIDLSQTNGNAVSKNYNNICFCRCEI